MADAHDPVRFRDSSRPEEQRLSQLFRAAESDVPSARELQGLAARLGPALDVEPATSAAPSGFSKLGALGGAAAVLAIIGGYLLSRGPARVEVAPVPAAPSVSAQPSQESEIAPAPPTAPALEPPASRREEVKPPTASAKPAAQKPDEAALLEQARRALATNPTQALALTRRHQALYPHGALVQEREVIAIEALRRLGRGGQASERANSFEKSFPDSAHRRAVEKGLGE